MGAQGIGGRKMVFDDALPKQKRPWRKFMKENL